MTDLSIGAAEKDTQERFELHATSEHEVHAARHSRQPYEPASTPLHHLGYLKTGAGGLWPITRPDLALDFRNVLGLRNASP